MSLEPEDLRVGWVYLVHIRGQQISKPHYAVVTRTEGDYCEVVYGQSKPDPRGDHVEVGPKKARSALHIPPKTGSNSPQPTYFRASNVVLVAVRNFIGLQGECTDDQLWFKLDGLAETARRSGLIEDQLDHQPPDSSEPPP